MAQPKTKIPEIMVSDPLAHISVGRADLPLEPVDLSGAVALVRADLEADIRDKQAAVDSSLVRGRVMANPASLHLVLTNLLSNALKFMPRGRKPLVRVCTEELRDSVKLWVEDNGTGINMDYKDQLFAVFQRLHTRDVYPGTGIGLAIVKRAVERMGGEVGFESREGVGSRFWFDLRKAA